MELEEQIWKDAFSFQVVSEIQTLNESKVCSNCESENIMYDCRDGTVCGDCGLVLQQFAQVSEYAFEEARPMKQMCHNTAVSNSRIQKIQEWMTWNNAEKSEYKLKTYTRELCEQLNIYTNIIQGVCHMVVKVMNSIKSRNDGPKRSRVKDGIIVSCIHYISKEQGLQVNYLKLARSINLDIKYVSKADKILMDLNFLDNSILNLTESPIGYIQSVVQKYSLQNRINNIDEFVAKSIVLVNICEDNDILLDNTPVSVGCSCFFYVLSKSHNLEIDIDFFAEMFGLSSVTITKTVNKLKVLEMKIDKLLF